MVDPHRRQRNADEPPHCNEIRTCEHAVEINAKALVRLLMVADRSPVLNGSDRVAIGMAEDALGMGDVIIPDIPDDLPEEIEITGPSRDS